ncbi:MAG: penicillin-binding transpeptidase domain-containing protein, partial [Spirochaetales bacterium]
FATIANQGKEVMPLAIRYVEDRNGKVIAEPEKELRNLQRKKGRAAQILSPQAAYIMTDMMRSTIDFGTLAYARNSVNGLPMPMAGKTGTTQNWSDIWTVGYSPYYTTAIWFGFDQPGNSLGVNQTGATVPGPIWARFMKDIHANLPPKDFPKPEGIVNMTVTARSGLIPPPNYNLRTIQEVFIAGTEPKRFDDFHEFEEERNQITIERLRNALLPQDVPLQEVVPNVGLQIDPRILTGSGSFPQKSSPESTFVPQGEKPTHKNPLLD